MAKGKAANPADAFRKAQRKKELKKHKAERAKTRDFALVKKDTHDLEDEIEKLSSDPAADQKRLKDLQAELESINKKKEEYVAEHPEQRKLVYRPRRTAKEREEEEKEVDTAPKTRKLFDKRGMPLHPERSIYYDPVMNPYGVAPPGMPYMERPLRPDEMEVEEEEEASDADIAMPEGPPPEAQKEEEEEDSDYDIPLPPGPPPPKPGSQPPPPLPPPVSPPLLTGQPPFPPGFPPPPTGLPPFAPPFGMPTGAPPPPGFSPPPYGFPPPPPPPGFPMGAFPPPPPTFPPGLPAPPPGFFPRRAQSSGARQDPLSALPHQTFQAHRAAAAHAEAHAQAVQISAPATVSAAPQLRDFKKESTAFVPAALKRRKAAPAPAAGTAGVNINAAPVLAREEGAAEAAGPVRPDLVGALKGQFGAAGEARKPKGDYEKFMEDMGDILGK